MKNIAIFVIGIFIASAIGTPINEPLSSQNSAENEIVSNSASILEVKEHEPNSYEMVDELHKCAVVMFYGYQKCNLQCIGYCQWKKCGSFKKCDKIPGTKTRKGSKYACYCQQSEPKMMIKDELELDKTFASVENANILEAPAKNTTIPKLTNSPELEELENPDYEE